MNFLYSLCVWDKKEFNWRTNSNIDPIITRGVMIILPGFDAISLNFKTPIVTRIASTINEIIITEVIIWFRYIFSMLLSMFCSIILFQNIFEDF